MDRTELTNVIDSGRSVALDCYAIGGDIPDGDPVGRLFDTDILNKSVILKQYERIQPKATKSTMFDAEFLKQFGGGKKAEPMVNVNTVIYFPYDFDDVYEGGESIVYRGRGFIHLFAEKIALGLPSRDLMLRLKADVEMLDLLDAMHSLDPFLLRAKAEQVGLMAEIHPKYLAISQQEWDQIQIPIRDKISRLVSKALGNKTDAGVEQDQVSLLLDKIWHAQDVDGIEPFVRSLQIEEREAPSLFFAWKAVCYYQYRFALMKEEMKTMFHWMGNDQLCFPADFLQISKGQRNRIVERRKALRLTARDGFVAAHKVLSEYEHSYNQFVNEDQPRHFLSFLANAENSYLELAGHVSIATHCLNFWRRSMARHGPEMRYHEFKPLFDGLLALYNVKMSG